MTRRKLLALTLGTLLGYAILLAGLLAFAPPLTDAERLSYADAPREVGR